MNETEHDHEVHQPGCEAETEQERRIRIRRAISRTKCPQCREAYRYVLTHHHGESS